MSTLEGIVLDGLDLNSGAAAAPSSFAPTNIAGCELWLAADKIVGHVDGDAIGTWSDASGLGHDATQATGANQPLYKTAIINGLPVVRFDGSNDSLSVAGITNNDATRTVFVVLKDITAGVKLLFSLAGSSSNSATIFQDGSGVYQYEKTQAAGTVTFGTALHTPALLTLRFNSTSSADAFFNNGTATNFDPDDGYQSGSNPLAIGTGLSTWWNGDIAEIISYNTALADADVDTVRNYLGGKYGLGFGTTTTLSAGAFILQGFECPPPAKRQEWAQGADSDGALLVRDPLFDNREVTVRLRVAQQTTMDAALTQISLISKKLEEAEQQPDGLPLVWTPANSTKSVTFYVLSGTIDGLPITLSGDDAGWFLKAPVVTVKLQCKPFGYGTPVTSSTASSATPFVTLTLASVPGDVLAEGRLQVTDAATQNRRYIEWGLESRYLDLATSLGVNTFVTSGFSGASTTRSGSFNANVIRGTLVGSPLAICGTGNLGHVGTFRVRARVYASAAGEYVRLSWREGDGPLRANSYAAPPIAGAFSDVDLGVVTIPPKQLGTQRWTAQIEAYTTGTAGTDMLDIDFLLLVPCGEGYGKARAPLIYETITAPVARDEFNQSAGALSGKTAPIGGAWTTSGAATDLAVEATGHTVTRNTNVSGQRFAISGATAQTDQIVQVDVAQTASGGLMTAIGRWTDSSNYLNVDVGNSTALVVHKQVAGVSTLIGSVNLSSVTWATGNWYTLRLYVDTSGRWAVWFGSRGSAFSGPLLTGQDSALATGGALASGKAGFADDLAVAGLTITRSYDNFAAATPTTPVALYSGRVAEIRYDGAIRQDSTGTYYGPVPAYRGSRFLVPAAGDENRSSRIFVKAHRNDIEAEPYDNVTDNLTIQTIVTPRYVVAPF